MGAYARKVWLAHYETPTEIPVPSSSVIGAFEDTVRRIPEAPALRYFDRTISFRRLEELAARFAALLAALGIQKGDRVALSLQNDPSFAIAQLGVWKRGGVVVPLNPMFKEKELRLHLQDSGARVWVCLDSLWRGLPVEHVVTTSREDVEMVRLLEPCGPEARARIPVRPEDIAYLVYTSGTTGSPKGAVILHQNVLFNAEVYRHWFEVGPEDAILGMAPLFHITGLVAQLALAFVAGVPLILFHRFDAVQALALSRKWQATISVAAITAYIALLNANHETATFVSKCYSGGAPVPPKVTEQFEKRFGTYIHNIYGLTESSSPSHAVPLGARAPTDPKSGALSIGIPVLNCEAKIVDLADPDREAPVGEAGELALRGPMMFAGYWNKPEATASAFRDGFFLTGDVAVMDEKGWFYLVDRKKDMIVASGFKIWPREVEDTLYEHPSVREAAVVGVPDAYRGETVKAFVALKENFQGLVDAEQLIAFCRDRIAAYKCPRQVEFVPEIPKTATGKFLRRALRS
jgi:long-chain acyl-CoA synthetase